MSLVITTVLNFGLGKPALATAVADLLAADQVTVLQNDQALSPLGSGDYGVDITLPDGFTRGYVKGFANDGSGDTVSAPVNLVDIGAVLVGAGDRLAEFLVTDELATPIPGANITLRSGAVTVAWGTTGGTGRRIFGLPAGTYSYVVTAGPFFGQVTNGVLVVPANADPGLTTVVLPANTAPPAAGGLCTLRVYVTESRTPVPGYTVLARLVEENNALSDELVSRVVPAGVTPSNGIVDLTLIQGGQFLKGGPRKGVYEILVTAPDGTVTHRYRGRAPNTLTANAEDLIPE